VAARRVARRRPPAAPAPALDLAALGEDHATSLDGKRPPKPDPGLLDRYFAPAPADRTAVLAGGSVDVPGGDGLPARISAGRAPMSQRVTLDRPGTPYAQSANMAVRRSLFDAIGGFDPVARAGEDADLCFRLAAAGWALEERPEAVVRHSSRATLPSRLAQLARHGSGAAWLNRRYPNEFPPPRPRELAARLARTAGGAAAAGVRGRREAAAAELVELCCACAFETGRLLSNRARGAL